MENGRFIIHNIRFMTHTCLTFNVFVAQCIYVSVSASVNVSKNILLYSWRQTQKPGIDMAIIELNRVDITIQCLVTIYLILIICLEVLAAIWVDYLLIYIYFPQSTIHYNIRYITLYICTYSKRKQYKQNTYNIYGWFCGLTSF